MTDRCGPDGYGSRPKGEVAKVRDQFFGEGPPPRDPRVVDQAKDAIEKRTPVWRKLRRGS